MKSKLKLISTKDMSQEDWLSYRDCGIGASDVGTILGLNPYKCSAQLFYEKIGGPVLNLENMAMFMGKEQEAFISNLWEYWDPSNPTEAAMIENYRAGRKVRRCRRVNAYVHNPDFPWLFVSLDRKINATATVMSAGKKKSVELSNEGALEIKTIAGYEADKWEAGIPPAHVVQVQTQLLVCEFSFGELAVLKDGRELDVIPFEYNPDICQTIIQRTGDFWERVKRGRILANRKFEAVRNFNFAAVEAIDAEFSTIEPEPDGSEAFEKYLKERYKIAEPGEQTGTDEQLTWAQRDLNLKSSIETLNTERREVQNRLKNVLRDGADKITFAGNGYVSWKNDTNGVRRFLNKVSNK